MLVNYILDAIQENRLTSSTAKKVDARTDLLQAVEFIVNSWRSVSTKTVLNCFAHCSFKHLDLEMPNTAAMKMTPYWKCATSEITRSFHESTIVLNIIMKMKIMRKQLLNKLQGSIRRYQIGRPTRMIRLRVNE
jgi:hypothetical protein